MEVYNLLVTMLGGNRVTVEALSKAEISTALDSLTQNEFTYLNMPTGARFLIARAHVICAAVTPVEPPAVVADHASTSN